MVGEAEAIVGAPMTPFGVAGVARRTASRSTAVVSSSAASSRHAAAASEQQAAAKLQQARVARQQTAAAEAQAAAARLPVGTTVTALPRGRTSAKVSGVVPFDPGGTFYGPALQSHELVSVVARP